MRAKLPHPGSLVAFAIVALVAGGFVALRPSDGGKPALLSIGPYLTAFSCSRSSQAALSTILSLALGVALALGAGASPLPGPRRRAGDARHHHGDADHRRRVRRLSASMAATAGLPSGL